MKIAGDTLQARLLELPEVESWSGPFPEELRARAVDALEDGKVVLFPKLPFELPESERKFLSPAFADGKAKNISLDPGGSTLKGAAATATEADRQGLQGMMARFATSAGRLMADLFPEYSTGLEQARTSYRPVEIAGRQYSTLKDDTLLHVDAFPSTPTKGRRILRLFSNIAPGDHARLWRVGEPFPDFAKKCLPSVPRPNALAAWALHTIRATRGRRSAYDQLMLGLHDGAKRNSAYQKDAPRIEVAFRPGTTWMCYTDEVLHAVLGGQYALEQTFHVDIAAMVYPARSPLKVLEGMMGRPLTS